MWGNFDQAQDPKRHVRWIRIHNDLASWIRIRNDLAGRIRNQIIFDSLRSIFANKLRFFYFFERFDVKNEKS